MSADDLISRLDGVKKTGQTSWKAKCPSHKDRTPSLTVRELPDGRVLLHCFAGCDTHSVLDSVGLTFHDIMPEYLGNDFQKVRQPFNPRDVLDAVANEAMIVAMAASDKAHGREVSGAEKERLQLAAFRLLEAKEMVDGYR